MPASRECSPLSDSIRVYVYRIQAGVAAGRKDPLDNCIGFDWDDGNASKNWERHHVSPEEAEDVFFNEPLIVRSDVRHSREEKRHYALGQTSGRRLLFVAFTIRKTLIRVISVRDMTRQRTRTVWQVRRSRFLNFAQKKTSVSSRRRTIRQSSLTGVPRHDGNSRN